MIIMHEARDTREKEGPSLINSLAIISGPNSPPPSYENSTAQGCPFTLKHPERCTWLPSPASRFSPSVTLPGIRGSVAALFALWSLAWSPWHGDAVPLKGLT